MHVRGRALLESEARECTTQSMNLLLSPPSFSKSLFAQSRFSDLGLKKQALLMSVA